MWDKLQMNMKVANMDHEEIEENILPDEDVSLEETFDDADAAELDADNQDVVAPDDVVALDDPLEQKRLIEALIFASPEPVSLRLMQARLPASADVGGILLALQDDYKGRGVELVRLEDAWAFRTAADVGPYLSLAKKDEKKLSRAALETLAVIAYHQPVTRAEVENIRGVATNKGTLDVLLEAGWIKPGRRRETPGRPVTWITTTSFLDEFGVSQLNDLPGLQELKASGLLDTRPAIETIPGAADLFDGLKGEPSGEEGDSPALERSIEENGEFDQVSVNPESEEKEIA